MSFFQDLKNTYMTYEPKKRSFLSHGGSFLIFCSLVFFLFFCESIGLENFGGFLLGPFLMDLSTIFFLPLVYFAFFYGMFPKFGILLLLGVFLFWNRKLLYRKK